MVLLLRCVLCSTGTSVRVHLGANIDAEKFFEGGEMNLGTNTAGFTAFRLRFVPGGALMGGYLVLLLEVIVWLIPLAILVFFISRVITISKQPDRIEALLLRDRRLTYEQKESG